jgi:hypothetical protein
MIRINPKYHPQHPSKGCNGALTIVDGRVRSGDVGKMYPTLLKSKVGYLQYIGHYQVVNRVAIPVETWLTWPDDEKYSIAEEVGNKKWAVQFLNPRVSAQTLLELRKSAF